MGTMIEEKRTEHESQWGTHLVILLMHSLLCSILIMESIILKWEAWPIPLILLEMVICWGFHLSQLFAPDDRIMLYAVLEAVTFFYYGSHATSFYDLAPVMTVMIMVYTITSQRRVISLAVITYFFTVLYGMAFVEGDRIEITYLNVTRILLHFMMVITSAIVSSFIIRERSNRDAMFMDEINSLKETNERTEDFLTNVSHELRTPINVVTGISSVLLRNEKNARRKQNLGAIQDAGRRLFEQIGDILDHTEINTGRLAISEDDYMMSSLINDLDSEIKVLFEDRKTDLIFDIDPFVPSVLRGDARKIRKIIRHVIGNAIKFTRVGGVYVRISAIKKEYGINLIIRVQDTGIGIDPDKVEYITRQFYQVNAGRDRSSGGLGLGLSIVQGLTNAMEGFMQIKSEKNKGTTVLISIPQKVVDETPCMRVEHPGELEVAHYDLVESYEVEEVREFYADTIENLTGALGLRIRRITEKRSLDKLLKQRKLTHLFVAWDVYEPEADYFESASSLTNLYVFAPEGFLAPDGSRVRIVPAPFNSFMMVNALNAKSDEEIEAIDEGDDRRMICAGVNVLVVDDEVMNLVVARGLFKDYQLIVSTATSGQEAIELCRKNKYDIVFMDHMMPEMDGIEAMKLIRQEAADNVSSIVALTANAVSGAREMFLTEGFDEFISKPIEYRELERVLRKVLPPEAVRYELAEIGIEANIEQTHTKNDPASDSTDPVLESLSESGIDTALGLDHCMGDEQFYYDTLMVFAEELDEDGIEEAGLRDSVYHIGMMARTLGATEIYEIAERLIEAIDGRDSSAETGYINAFRLCQKTFVTNIRRILEGGSVKEEHTKFIDKAAVMKCVGELTEALGMYEVERAGSLLGELKAMEELSDSAKRLLDDIEGDIRNFDFKKAVIRLEKKEQKWID